MTTQIEEQGGFEPRETNTAPVYDPANENGYHYLWITGYARFWALFLPLHKIPK